VKRNNSGSRAVSCCGGPGRLVGTNVTLGMLIRVAYNVHDFQISGGPPWIESVRYDVEGKTDDAAGRQQTAIVQGPMLQRLLEDRFSLAVRHEIRELPVYELTIAKSGSKLKAGNCIARDLNVQPPSAGRTPDYCGFLVTDNNMMKATQIDMVHFTDLLSLWVKRTVIDKTGITNRFDVDLRWNPDESAAAPSADPFPSIFTALQDQLGLKLESGRGPVEVLVIDSVSKPSEN
jgi:uncharacterized protein (TIGR03435 family)